MYMYVFMCVCRYVFVYITYTHTHTHTHKHTRTNTHTYVTLHLHLNVYIYINMHTLAQVCLQVHMCMYSVNIHGAFTWRLYGCQRLVRFLSLEAHASCTNPSFASCCAIREIDSCVYACIYVCIWACTNTVFALCTPILFMHACVILDTNICHYYLAFAICYAIPEIDSQVCVCISMDGWMYA